MSIGSIGSTPSFWQQDQSYWQNAQSNDSSSAATDSVINAISSAETSLGKGLASIANQSALNRVNSQLSAAIQNILDGGSSSSSATTSSSSSSSSSSTSSTTPATGTGTAPVSIGTSLSSLGILKGGTITVSAGANTTVYTTTGSDTVGDLMNALNNSLVGNAAVTASLNRDGELVITSKNTTDMIAVGGMYASNIGFGVNNDTFKPTAAATSSSTAATTSSATSSSTASATSSTSSSSTTTTTKSYSTLASETASSAAALLSDSGVGGTLVDMLA